jgi:hypothetical protein
MLLCTVSETIYPVLNICRMKECFICKLQVLICVYVQCMDVFVFAFINYFYNKPEIRNLKPGLSSRYLTFKFVLQPPV